MYIVKDYCDLNISRMKGCSLTVEPLVEFTLMLLSAAEDWSCPKETSH